MIQFFFILLAALFGSVVVQHFIPPILFLEGARVFLMPVVFFYAALALPFWGMLVMALFCGFMWDSLTVQIVEMIVGPSTEQVVEIALGWSILLYAVFGAIVSGFRPLYLRGRWEIHCLMSGIFTSLLVLSEFLMISVRRVAMYKEGFVFTPEIGWRIGGAGIVALALAPIVFWVLTFIAASVGYHPRRVFAEDKEAV